MYSVLTVRNSARYLNKYYTELKKWSAKDSLIDKFCKDLLHRVEKIPYVCIN